MRTKPFPWKCAGCRERAVHLATVDYAATVDHDGRSYDLRIPELEVPQCKKCGKLVLVDSANQKITEALRGAAGLLRPEQIRANREKLALTQKQLANHIGTAEATISRWETGAQIQQRSLDRLLRLFFAFEPVRVALGNEGCVAELGTSVATLQPFDIPYPAGSIVKGAIYPTTNLAFLKPDMLEVELPTGKVIHVSWLKLEGRPGRFVVSVFADKSKNRPLKQFLLDNPLAVAIAVEDQARVDADQMSSTSFDETILTDLQPPRITKQAKYFTAIKS